jgi:peptide/nickel transport system ATP-binding protein
VSQASVEGAVVQFTNSRRAVRALDGVDFEVAAGETVAVVGESGCGKTTLARVILGLQPLTAGSATLAGRPVLGVRRGQAADVGMVWQDPYASLDPRWTIGKSVAEPARLLGRELDLAALLRDVGLDETFASRYPHQLSGGQRQRAAIARAIALRPGLVICDEPTAALDLSVQAQVLNLLVDLKRTVGSAFLFISHDLGTVRFLAERVVVMYLGKVVEQGRPADIFDRPMHPYTRMLVDSTPSLQRLGHLPPPAPGEPPDPSTRWVGCRYEGRCSRAVPACGSQPPPWAARGDQFAACHMPIGLETPSGRVES